MHDHAVTRLFVGNVGYNITETILSEELAKVGVVASNIKIARDKETRGPKGFGFIEVPAHDAERVMKIVNGLQLGNKTLRAELASRQPHEDRQSMRPARPRRERPPVQEFSSRAADGDVWRDDRRRQGGRQQRR